jgi:hypothetical protein
VKTCYNSQHFSQFSAILSNSHLYQQFSAGEKPQVPEIKNQMFRKEKVVDLISGAYDLIFRSEIRSRGK